MTSDLSGIYQSRIRILESIIREYNGVMPLHKHLKNVFSANKSYGSTDRRFYNAYSHIYFRLGKALNELPFLERLAVAMFLNGEEASPFAEVLFPNYPAILTLSKKESSTEERIAQLRELFPSFTLASVFNTTLALSNGISTDQFVTSLLTQPWVWIRIDQGRKQFVLNDFKKNNIEFSEVEEVICCKQNTPLDKLETYTQGFFEVQDLSSQIAGNMIPVDGGNRWWDCCSGAGGKALHLADRNHQILLTVSDVRQTVLDNLKERFKRHHFRKPEMFLSDLQKAIPSELKDRLFDGILIDAPCSGSGTWARTPEAFSSFDSSTVTGYTDKQKDILRNVVDRLRPDGNLAYITCSVFKAENEDIITFAQQELKLKLVNQQLINGSQRSSDSMFMALLTK